MKKKNKINNYLLKKKTIKIHPPKFSSLIKYFFKTNSLISNKKNKLFWKTLIKFFFIFLKYMKLLKYNSKSNKFAYRANFNKLKHKFLILKTKKINDIKPKQKTKKDNYLKSLNLIAVFLFSYYLIYSNSIKQTNTQKNKTLIFSNLFSILINNFEFLINTK